MAETETDRHPYLTRLLAGDLGFRAIAQFAGQYHHVVAERHAAEGMALFGHSPAPYHTRESAGGDLARAWLRFTLSVGGLASAPQFDSTRRCVRRLSDVSGGSRESAIGVVVAIDRVDAALAGSFRDATVQDAYGLRPGAALEYFEQYRARREVWLDAVGADVGQVEELRAEATASDALWHFLDGLKPQRHQGRARRFAVEREPGAEAPDMAPPVVVSIGSVRRTSGESRFGAERAHLAPTHRT